MVPSLKNSNKYPHRKLYSNYFVMKHLIVFFMQTRSSIDKFIVVSLMLFIAVNNEQYMLDFYQLDFISDLPARILSTQTLPTLIRKLPARSQQFVICQLNLSSRHN